MYFLMFSFVRVFISPSICLYWLHPKDKRYITESKAQVFVNCISLTPIRTELHKLSFLMNLTLSSCFTMSSSTFPFQFIIKLCLGQYIDNHIEIFARCTKAKQRLDSLLDNPTGCPDNLQESVSTDKI